MDHYFLDTQYSKRPNFDLRNLSKHWLSTASVILIQMMAATRFISFFINIFSVKEAEDSVNFFTEPNETLAFEYLPPSILKMTQIFFNSEVITKLHYL